MGTSSTKSNASKQRREAAKPDLKPQSSFEISEKTWRIAAISIFVIAAFLRLYHLELVPLHHDEGVNGNFLISLVRDGRYKYDPANYHGPTLYYLTAVIPWIIKILFGPAARDSYGLTTFVIRFIPAFFGLATIVLVFLLRRRLGTMATLCAAFFLAISPGAVYLSRYYIHETLFVFFTLGIVVAGLRFWETRNQLYLLLASASAAMLFATKETAMISAAVLIIALAATLIYPQLLGQGGPRKKKNVESESFIDEVGGGVSLALWIGLAVAVFVAINIFFYSSFFTNYPQGVYDSLKTFQIWTKTGQQAHVHSATTYLQWLTLEESPLLFLGSIGAVFVVFRPKKPFALFSALWAFGIIAAYSLVPYKTPWLALNFIVPLALIAGYAVQRIYQLERGQIRLPIVILAIAVLIAGYQTIDLNFFNYDNDSNYYVYVYAHTKRGTTELVNDIDKFAQQSAEGAKTGITIVSPDYWPLPWYLRNYSRVGYFGHMTQSTEPIIIASETQQAEMESTFGGVYRQVRSSAPDGTFPLRPGVNLLLYVRQP
ncbi:MAG TPA: flippase activity-associated protein Agl23 [Pyrinomonadaceae bacterium]